MNKRIILKLLFIIFVNVFIFIFLLFVSEICTYKYYEKTFYKTHPKFFHINKYTYNTFLSDYVINFDNFFNGQKGFSGRKPDGIEYTDKAPILIFGCSFAYGQYLDDNQTFSYKLSHLLQRPVYNRAITGGSLQHMLFQTENESFYNAVPPSDTVIYIMISDSYRRIFLNYFDILDLHILPHFEYKNNDLIYDDNKNILKRFFNSLYTVKNLNHIYAKQYLKNSKNSEELTNLALLYFMKSREILEKKWNKKINFIIITYDIYPIMYKDILQTKLENNGFIVFGTNELTDENLKSDKYWMSDNMHPNENAWDLLTPLIIDKLKEKNII